jgi:hypothetical protein
MNNLIKPQEPAICPMCLQKMVYAVINVDGQKIWAWLCNCRMQPDTMLADIENARREPGTSLIYELEIVNEPTGTRNQIRH